MLKRAVAITALVAWTIVAGGHPAMAQSKPAPAATQPASKAELPTGEAVLTKYVEASGGQAAFDKIRNRVAHGTLDLGAAGVTMSISIYAAKPDRAYTLAESDATGRIESGVVDGIAWENSAFRGAIVKDGAEKADAQRDATLDRLAYWKDNTKKVECVGIADVDGKPAYKVAVWPKLGGAMTLYFDKESGLLVQSETMMVAAGQTIELTSKPSDYRPVDGIKMPFLVKQYVMGQERTIKFDKIENNVEMPADRFALPAAIKAIVEKK